MNTAEQKELGSVEQELAKCRKAGGIKRFRLTRTTRTHVYVRWKAYGNRPGLSRRIPLAEFRADWVRLPQRECMTKASHAELEKLMKI